MKRARKWAYDITVNTIANGCALLIGYLAGAYFGLFPRNPGAITFAVAVLVFVAGFLVIFGGGLVFDDTRILVPVGIGFVALGLAVGACAVAAAWFLPWFSTAALAVLAVGLVGFGCMSFRDFRRERAMVREWNRREAEADE